MSRTLTALFDTRDDAEAGRQRLIDARIDADDIRIHDKGHISDAGYERLEDAGLWASVKNAFLPDEDRHAYEEGLRRGGYLLVADVDSDDIDEAIRALETTPGVDIEERAAGWREEGWQTPAYAEGRADYGREDYGRTGAAGERLEVVEEQLVVGKREVERGGVRVRSYVTEKPVHEQVTLRKEHVNVDRHAVDRGLTGGVGDAFQERTVELTETSEEAVVGKQARVVEEVVVSKDVDTVTQDIDETVPAQGRRGRADRHHRPCARRSDGRHPPHVIERHPGHHRPGGGPRSLQGSAGFSRSGWGERVMPLAIVPAGGFAAGRNLGRF